MKTTKRTWIFLGMTFALSWGICGVAYARGLRIDSPAFIVVALGMMFCPLACAALCITFFPETRPDGAKPGFPKAFASSVALRFKMGWGNFFLSWLIFPAIVLAALGIGLLIPGVRYDSSMADLFAKYAKNLSPEAVETMRKSLQSFPVPVFLVTMLQGLVAGATVNAVAGFGEEAGWRGYLVKSMKGSNFWIASVFIGAVWGLWHAPLIIQGYNYPDHPVAGVFLMIAFCLLVSPIILYIRMRTRSSVAAAIAHGAINGTAGVAMMPLSGGSDITVGIMGFAGLTALALAVLAIYLVDRRSKRPVMSLRLGEEFPAGF